MDLDAGKYYYDMQIYDADHHMVTKLYGEFIVLQDITDMLYPEEFEPWNYMLSEVNYSEMPTVKNQTMMQSIIDYLEGTVNRNYLMSSSTLAYAFQLKNAYSLVMSSSVYYQFVTHYFRLTGRMTSTIDYVTTKVLSNYQLMTSEISYILYILD